jgi:MraZ protein
MAVPTKYHATLAAECERKLTLTRHPDGCLLMLPRNVWERKAVEIAKLPLRYRQWQRMFLGNACDVDMDASHRVLIPPELREAVNIPLEGKVMLAGMISHFEIWEAEAHARHMAATEAGGLPEDLDLNFGP